MLQECPFNKGDKMEFPIASSSFHIAYKVCLSQVNVMKKEVKGGRGLNKWTIELNFIQFELFSQ
jgi:hypothetical protein